MPIYKSEKPLETRKFDQTTSERYAQMTIFINELTEIDQTPRDKPDKEGWWWVSYLKRPVYAKYLDAEALKINQISHKDMKWIPAIVPEIEKE